LSDHWSIFNFGQGTFGISSSLSPTHICSSLVMDRQGISSPVFDNNDGVNKTNTPHFGLQWAMQVIDNITTDLRHSEARRMDYFDNKFSAQKEEQDARMGEIRTLLINRSSPSSSSRRRRENWSSSELPSDASASRPRPHLHGDHHHVRDPHRHEGQVTSKHHVHDDNKRHRAQAQQRHHHHEDACRAQMHKSQQALLHSKSKLHEQKRRPRDKHHQEDATTTTTTTLASLPSAIKASSPLDARHLRLLPMSSPTSTSSTTRRPTTSEGDTSIFGNPSRKMVGKTRRYPSPSAGSDREGWERACISISV